MIFLFIKFSTFLKNLLVEFWIVVANSQLESMWHSMQLQQHQKLLLRHFVLASIHPCILLHRRQLQYLLWNLKNNRFFFKPRKILMNLINWRLIFRLTLFLLRYIQRNIFVFIHDGLSSFLYLFCIYFYFLGVFINSRDKGNVAFYFILTIVKHY